MMTAFDAEKSAGLPSGTWGTRELQCPHNLSEAQGGRRERDKFRLIRTALASGSKR